jgi:hypothetical protein
MFSTENGGKTCAKKNNFVPLPFQIVIISGVLRIRKALIIKE